MSVDIKGASVKLIYIAGPYRGDVEGNICRAAEVAERVARAGFYPVTPHLLSPPHFEKLQGDEFWLSHTMELMRRCCAVLLMRNWHLSRGAIEEHKEATRLGMIILREETFEHNLPLYRLTAKTSPSQTGIVAGPLCAADYDNDFELSKAKE